MLRTVRSTQDSQRDTSTRSEPTPRWGGRALGLTEAAEERRVRAEPNTHSPRRLHLQRRPARSSSSSHWPGESVWSAGCRGPAPCAHRGRRLAVRGEVPAHPFPDPGARGGTPAPDPATTRGGGGEETPGHQGFGAGGVTAATPKHLHVNRDDSRPHQRRGQEGERGGNRQLSAPRPSS